MEKQHENYFIGGFRLKNLNLILFAFFTLVSGQSFSQGCLTNTLIINTGYDPAVGTSIPPGINHGVPVRDPRWFVSACTDVSIALGLVGGDILVLPTSTPNSANVIPRLVPLWANNPPSQPGGWISCLNSNMYLTNGDGITAYNMTLSRSFNMCFDDDVTFNLSIANDNFISSIDIDGVAIPFAQPAGNTFAHYTVFTAIPAITRHLSCGLHTINIVVNNFNVPGPVNNPTGLNVTGTIVSTTNSIVSENPACPGFACSIPPMTGTPLVLCSGLTGTLHATPAGGTWGTLDPTIATVSASGVVTGIAVGTATITYTFTNTCFTQTISTIVTVNPIPTASLSVSPEGTICVGTPVTLTASISPSGPGGLIYFWDDGFSSFPSTSIIVSPHVTTTYSFSVSDGICSSSSTVTVTVLPAPAPIVGPTSLCEGDIATYSCSPSGGTWSCTPVSVASIIAGTGIVTALSTGIATISYINADGCNSITHITVNPTPNIIGPDHICVHATGIYSSHIPGGSWSSSATAIADFSSGPGILTGYASGTTTITYALASCYATKDVTVSGLPPTVTVIGPPMHDPEYFYRIEVSGGCENYVVDYDLYLNAFSYCGYGGPVHKSIPIASGSFADFSYAYLSNGPLPGPGTSGGLASTPPYTYPYHPFADFSSSGCDPHALGSTVTILDWGIYMLCVTSVSGCGCTWPVVGCAGGKGAPNTHVPTPVNELTISPNPGTGTFTISGILTSVKISAEATIEIADMFGKVIHKTTAPIDNSGINKKITLGHEIVNGIYLVRIKNAELNEVIKFTLER